MISFYKYHGAGNDFILFDQRKEHVDYPEHLLRAYCDRHTGIGADGVMYLRAHDTYDFEMLYFNSDGRPGSMCGNGGRCIIAFAADRGIEKQQYRFLAPDGVHTGEILEQCSPMQKKIRLQMQSVSEIVKYDDKEFFIDTGSPHLLRFVEDVEVIDVQKEGSAIRYQQRFAPDGTNVCFVQLQSDNSVKVRTYERGVEAETLACGTGAVAAALAAVSYLRSTAKNVYVQYKGGGLAVGFRRGKNKCFDYIQLTGMAQFVYSGNIPSY